MNELPRTKPHVTSSGLEIYDLDYSLPREYIPSINIPTIITEDNHIKIDPSWEERYREVYAHYHQTEHIDKGVDERVYVSLEKILKFAKMWSSLVGIQTWAPDEEFADQHSCLCAQGYGHTYISIYIYNPTSTCIEPSRPLLYPEDIYHLQKNQTNNEHCNFHMQVIDTVTNTIVLREVL